MTVLTKKLTDKLKKLLSKYFFLTPYIIFSLLLFPVVNVPTCWDGGTEYSKVEDFTLAAYAHSGSLHPPLKAFLATIFFKFGGQNLTTYHIMGIMLGFIGIGGIYFLGKTLGNKYTAIIAAFLLSTFPLFLANATDNYTDYFVAVFISITLYFYARGKFFYYALFAIFTTLSKDTGLLLPLTVFFIELIGLFFKKKKFSFLLFRLLFILIPIIAYGAWYFYTKTMGVEVFNEYLFTDTGDKGTFVTIAYNLLTFTFFHEYTKKHLLQLFFLNFNWIYWVVTFLGILLFLKNISLDNVVSVRRRRSVIKTILIVLVIIFLYSAASILVQILLNPLYRVFSLDIHGIYILVGLVVCILLLKKTKRFVLIFSSIQLALSEENQKAKTMCCMFLFCIGYILTVGTLQIWDTPRYNLPIIPVLVVSTSFFITRYAKKISLSLFFLVFIINLLGIFFSSDPVSTFIWGKRESTSQTFYTIDKRFFANDSLVYNLEYLYALKKRAAIKTQNPCILNN